MYGAEGGDAAGFPLELAAALLALQIVLIGVAIWVHVAIRPRQQRLYAEHPERRPYGRRLLLRASPLAAILAASLGYGMLAQRPVLAFAGIVGLGCLGWNIWRRWEPPSN